MDRQTAEKALERVRNSSAKWERDARTVNHRLILVGRELCFALEPHKTDSLWLLAQTLSGRELYVHSDDVNLADDSATSILVSELIFS